MNRAFMKLDAGYWMLDAGYWILVEDPVYGFAFHWVNFRHFRHPASGGTHFRHLI